jgi:hypothetical protein
MVIYLSVHSFILLMDGVFILLRFAFGLGFLKGLGVFALGLGLIFGG